MTKLDYNGRITTIRGFQSITMVRSAQFLPTWDLVLYFKQQDLAIAGEINFMQVRTLF
jgi:hypothetical protein